MIANSCAYSAFKRTERPSVLCVASDEIIKPFHAKLEELIRKNSFNKIVKINVDLNSKIAVIKKKHMYKNCRRMTLTKEEKDK